jgi:phage recombination protein Bet
MHQYSESELKFIQQRFKLSDLEMDVFMAAAHRYGLNPLANQIYPQVRKDRKTQERTMVIATGIDGYRTLADRTGAYAGNDDPVFDEAVKKPGMATVTVYKVVGGVRCPFTATARWEQYVPQEGLDFMWRKMPHLMLGKVAEALALRKAFPAAISGLYTDAEMEQAGTPINVAEEEKEAPAMSQVRPPAQRAVPEERKPRKQPPPGDWDSESETPKSAFVRMVTEWSGADKKASMEWCKKIMGGLEVPTDGKAEMSDFLCCIKFVQQNREAMAIHDAIESMMRAKNPPSAEGEF